MESLRNDATRVVSADAPLSRSANAGSTSETSGDRSSAAKSDSAKDSAAREKVAFQIEAATWKLSAQFALIRSLNGNSGNNSGAAGGVTNQPLTPEQIIEQTLEFVRDVFQKNGIEFDENLSSEDATAKVASGGDQSPDVVAKRILDFVAAFANGDPARAKLLRDAVETGFEQAEGAWGSKLPDISYQTMDLVRKGLDELFKPTPTQGGSTVATTPPGSGSPASSPAVAPTSLSTIDSRA